MHHGVAEPKSGKQRLVQGPDVDDTLGIIEALERGERPAAVAEFTGVVVLDNPCAALARPAQKLEAARHRQDDAFGKLVRRRYENGARFRGAADALGDVDAILIDRDRATRRARRDERKAGQGVSGILDPDLPRWEERPG